MKRFLTALILVVIVGTGTYVLMRNKSNASASTSNTSTTASSSTNRPGTKLADSQYANYAYLISGDSLSADAQQALTGFTMTKQATSDGGMQIILTAKQSNYHNQTYTLKPGQSLYFIETSLGDDQGDQDTMLNDDTAVIVDANGYLVQ